MLSARRAAAYVLAGVSVAGKGRSRLSAVWSVSVLGRSLFGKGGLLERPVVWAAKRILGGEDKKARIISSHTSLNQGCLCQRSLPIEKV